MSTPAGPLPPYSPDPPATLNVVITDVDMPISAMARFMVKWAIAAIPAVIILWLLFALAGGLIAVLFGGLFHGWLTPPHQY